MSHYIEKIISNFSERLSVFPYWCTNSSTKEKKSLSVMLKARCNLSRRYLSPKLCSYWFVAASLLEPQAPPGMELKEYFLALYISELCCCWSWWIAFIVDAPSLLQLPLLSQHSHLDINLAFPCPLPPLSSSSPPAAPSSPPPHAYPKWKAGKLINKSYLPCWPGW